MADNKGFGILLNDSFDGQYFQHFNWVDLASE
jgi:hypothetical protein